MAHVVQAAASHWGRHAGENMCTNPELETRIVILEAALDWIRHEATAHTNDPHTMARIAAIALQVLEDDEITMTRRLANARDRSGVQLRDGDDSDASALAARAG
jgi:hypothetical protein